MPLSQSDNGISFINGAVEWTRTITKLPPPAPQAGASTNSATTAQTIIRLSVAAAKKEISVYIRQPALSTKNRYLAGAAGACTGWAGAAGAAGAPCRAGAAGALCCAGAAGADLDDMMEELFLEDDICARVSEVSMKSMAAPVVILFMKVLPPLAPNTVWLPPAPNDAPISAPLPD